MKNLVWGLVLVSFSTLACPNLTGTYLKCSSLTGQPADISDLKIEQNMINGTTVYEIHSKDPSTGDLKTERYEANGVPVVTTIPDAESGTSVTTETTASCKRDDLNLSLKITMDSNKIADLKVKVNLKNGQLTQIYSGESMGEPVNDTIICQ